MFVLRTFVSASVEFKTLAGMADGWFWSYGSVSFPTLLTGKSLIKSLLLSLFDRPKYGDSLEFAPPQCKRHATRHWAFMLLLAIATGHAGKCLPCPCVGPFVVVVVVAKPRPFPQPTTIVCASMCFSCLTRATWTNGGSDGRSLLRCACSCVLTPLCPSPLGTLTQQTLCGAVRVMVASSTWAASAT